MVERRADELKLITAKYGEVETDPNFGWLIIQHWALPPGWDRESTAVLVFIPPGYPVTPPDNFYTDNDLRLSNGQLPGNTTAGQTQLNRPWLQFSFHVETADWRPHANMLQGHNILTFLEGIAQRFCEAS